MRKAIHTVRQLVLSATMITMLFIGGVLHPCAATAATYYTAPTGSNSNPGTLGQPFQTIAKGLSVTMAGDTLYLRGGTYNEKIASLTQTIHTGTSWSNPVTVAGYPSETAILTQGIDFNLNSGDRYIIFQDFQVTTPNLDNNAAFLGGNYIRFLRMNITGWKTGNGVDTGGNGIQIGGHHNEIINSKIHAENNGPARSHGFYVFSSDNLIDGNEIYNNPGYGAQIYKCCSDADRVLVNRNVIRNNRIYHNGGSDNPGGIVIGSGADNQIYNNIIYNMIGGGSGIDVAYAAQNTLVYNNTIYGNTYAGVNISNNVSPATNGTQLKNNIVVNNAINIMDSGTNTVQSNNLTSNPGFVNAANGDFYLQASSPALDAGASINIVTVDFQGVPRPQGARHDIGAYEYQGLQLPAPSNLKTISVAP